ncbi:MAG: hypothetical protein OXT05_14850, partial [Chloroflexota bacterium]|nr:hypothetical protein [Chloroflexota bacterium]
VRLCVFQDARWKLPDYNGPATGHDDNFCHRGWPQAVRLRLKSLHATRGLYRWAVDNMYNLHIFNDRKQFRA